MHLMKHRSDIDGLRAVAVLPVVLFHLGAGFSGGYVGVDVFFVISGYLITALILQRLSQGRFTLVEFWERRVRRIVPALVVVVAVTLAAGWFLLLPDDYRILGKSAVAQSLMVANFFFFKTSGYFEESAELNPLLHTWSLAVEEQFYFILPLVLSWWWSRSRRWMVRVLAGLCCASLIASILGVYWFPKSTFYLLPTRAWELLLGSLLATMPIRPAQGRLREAVSACGLGAILIAIFAYDQKTLFPGAAALVPCLGTVAVLWANAPHPTWTGRLLSLRPLVFVGWISYSLYLWHWPLIVYAKSWSVEALSAGQQGLLFVAAFGLATLSWWFIERPFRLEQRLLPPRRVFAAAWGAFASLMLTSSLIVFGKGVPSRLPPLAVAYSEARHDRGVIREISLQESQAGTFLELGVEDSSRPIDLILWGDSHAMAVIPAVKDLCQQQGLRAVAATHSGTPPLMGLEGLFDARFFRDAAPYNQNVLAFVKRHRVQQVLLVGRWSNYETYWTERHLQGAEILRNRLQATVSALTDEGLQVYLMKEVPRFPTDVPRALALAVVSGKNPESIQMPESRHRRQVATVNAVLDSLRGPRVTVLDPAPWLVDSRGYCRLVHEGKPVNWDDDHLSATGAMLIRPMFDGIGVRQTAGLDPTAPGQSR